MNRSEQTLGDENVARLLGQAYEPPAVPAEFAARVQARLRDVAAEAAQQRAAALDWSPFNRRLAALAGVAALLGIVALGLRFMPRPAAPISLPSVKNDRPMVAAPSPALARAPRLIPGETLATRAGERRRVALPDGSVLSVNQNTALHYDALRHLTLKAGEIFVEVATHASSLFTVTTPQRAIRAVGTKFLVRANAEGTAVAVAQGQVHVSDWDGLLSAGQQLAPKANAVTPTPRLSYLLDWTRDLVASATPALVPANAYNGGALVAVDSQGHTAPLTLRKVHMDVHIEDGFARTTIDQTYFNHTPRRLEGTFYFPLPADASLSRLAMYVEGRLMEGGMVEREYGRTVFEQIVTKMKDPALLEWVDGRTFKMRVFPLEGRQEKRIILSYTQRLSNLYGRLSYRSPAGHSLGAVRDWSFHVRVKDGATIDWHCDSHSLTPRVENGDLLLDASAHQVEMERDIVLDLGDRAGASSVRFSTAEQDGYHYLMLRYRPDLPGTTQRQRRDWVFLFESSADRDPLLARTQVEVIRSVLANAEADDTFALLTVNTRVQRFAPTPLSATPENIAAALAFLDKAHLLGALDLDAGLTAAAELLHTCRNPVLVHLGSGQAVLGERGAEALAKRIPRPASYVGVAVGKRWSQDFMQRAADRCQGYVTQINPDEAVAWRSFDLLATLNTPRLLSVRVTDLEDKARFLSANTMLAQGEELCAIARLPLAAPLPKSLRITGTLDGRVFQHELPVESPRSGAAYLPRTWARLEIDRLLAEDAPKNKGAIITLSKAMYVMTPYTSLLVLENEAMYAQYKVDRGRKDHWAMYPCPPTIPVVYEPITGQPPSIDWNLSFDPITGQPINPLNDRSDWLDQENNQLGFYPPALALKVKMSSTIHSRQYHIQLEPPGLETLAQSVHSDAHLLERIRRENRELFIGSANTGRIKIVRLPIDTYIYNVTSTRLSSLADPIQQNLPLPPGTGGAMPNLDNATASGGFSATVGGSGGISLQNQFAGRSGATRVKMLQQGGGNARSEASVAAGLQWLALHQAQDGHWSLHEFDHHAREKPSPAGKRFQCTCDAGTTHCNDVAATAFALLPFLAAGITHTPSKTINKDYHKTVDGGLKYLLSQQNKEGWYGDELSAHAVATIALCEAYGLTSDPRLKPSAQRALNFISHAQNSAGGWGDKARGTANLFASGWMILALKSGQMAGLSVFKKTLKLSERFLDACEQREKGYYSVRPGESGSPTPTAIGLLCRQYSGGNPHNPGLLSGLLRLKALPPEKTADLEYVFFATQFMHHMQGEPWHLWNEGVDGDGRKIHNGMRDTLISRQDTGTTPDHAHQLGSWAPNGPSSSNGGRIVSTVLSLLCLEVYYRHLPLYRQHLTQTAEGLVPFPRYLLDTDPSPTPDSPDPAGEERLLAALLADPLQAKHPSLWRRAARVAEQRKQYDIAQQRLERALELEANRPCDLAALRRDYAWFLSLAHQRAKELIVLRRPVPRDLLDRVVMIADRWRAVDPMGWIACDWAARILRLTGERELAWSYLTTPLAEGASAAGWLELARQQHWQGDYAFAERAFAVAASLEPANTEVIRERAVNQRVAREAEEAKHP